MAKNDRDSARLAWDETLVAQIGAAARRARGNRSAKWLSDRTAELGYRISPQIIARLDTGNRAGHFELAELLVIAKALDVPPALLLFPIGIEREMEILPGRVERPWDAYEWFIGVEGLGEDDSWTDGVEPITLYRQLYDALGQWHDAVGRATRVFGEAPSMSAEMTEMVSSWRESAEREVVRIRARMRQLGLEPPRADERIEKAIEGWEGR